MSIRTQLGALAMASLLAVVAASASGEEAHAAITNPKNKTASVCLSQGYQWDDVRGCADKTCTFQGKTYDPGAEVYRLNPDSVETLRCDGFTGRWVVMAGQPPNPTGPAAPRTGGTASR